MFGRFSLAGNRVLALHLGTRVFLAGNYISDVQRDKEQERAGETRRRNLRNLSKEILERSRGRRRREISMKMSVKLREIEQETKDLFKTVFLLNLCLASSHIL